MKTGVSLLWPVVRRTKATLVTVRSPLWLLPDDLLVKEFKLKLPPQLPLVEFVRPQSQSCPFIDRNTSSVTTTLFVSSPFEHNRSYKTCHAGNQTVSTLWHLCDFCLSVDLALQYVCGSLGGGCSYSMSVVVWEGEAVCRTCPPKSDPYSMKLSIFDFFSLYIYIYGISIYIGKILGPARKIPYIFWGFIWNFWEDFNIFNEFCKGKLNKWCLIWQNFRLRRLFG